MSALDQKLAALRHLPTGAPTTEEPSDPAALLGNLRRRGLRVWLDGDVLRVGPAGQVAPALAALIREHKPALVELLKAEADDLPEFCGHCASTVWIYSPAGRPYCERHWWKYEVFGGGKMAWEWTDEEWQAAFIRTGRTSPVETS